MVAANPAGGDHHCLCSILKVSDNLTGRRLPTHRTIFGKDLPAHASHSTIFHNQIRDFAPECQFNTSTRHMLPHQPLKWCNHARPCAPSDVKPRYRVAVSMCHLPTALCPANNREPAHADAFQPRMHLPRSELQIGFRCLSRVGILRSVELRRPHPIGKRQFRTVFDAHTTLFGRIHHEQPAQRPERLPAKALSTFLVQHQHFATSACGLISRHKPCQAAANDNHIGHGPSSPVPEKASPRGLKPTS
mmetsp:Transcript_26837/g.48474  ORF Transcript_26837/g.48474 Transcript_26837/m.48474 type:complete len:247 (-) Transcript_26837:16-756(-)